MALIVGLLFATWHALHNAPLADSVLLQSYNWLFDFDATRFVAWCTPGQSAERDFSLSFVSRHPLALALRPVCLPLLPLTSTPQAALMLMTALVAGATTSLAYLIAAECVKEEPDRLLLAICFGVWAQPLLQGLVPEIYGLAMAGIGLHFLLLCRYRGSGLPLKAPGWAFVSLVLNLGFTMTNAGLDAVSSVMRAWRQASFGEWLRINLLVAAGAVALVTLLAVAGAYLIAPGLLSRGEGVVREIWWAANISRDERASAGQVLWTFLGYNVVAPGLSMIDLAPGEQHWMADFREPHFRPIGWVAMGLWLTMFVAAVILVLRSRERRRDGVIAVTWILSNVALHAYWQMRGSVFLYGPHVVFPMYALLVWGWDEARHLGWKTPPHLALAALIALLALNNLEIYQQVIDFALRPPPHSAP